MGEILLELRDMALRLLNAMILEGPEDEQELHLLQVLLGPEESDPIDLVVEDACRYLDKNSPKDEDGYLVYSVRDLDQRATEVIDKLVSDKPSNEEQLHLLRVLVNPSDWRSLNETFSKASIYVFNTYRKYFG